RIRRQFDLPDGAAARLKTGGDGRVWLQSSDRRTVIGLAPDRAEEPPLRVRLAKPSAIDISADGKILAAAAANSVEWHDITGPLPRLTASFDTNIEEPTQAAILDAKRHALLAARSGGELVNLRGGAAVRLTDEAGSGFCLDRNGEMLFAAILKHDSIAVFRLPDGVKPEITVSPGKLKPQTRGGIFRLFALTAQRGELLEVDECARVFRLVVKPRRWEKKMVFAPELAPRK
ncbi:MAG: hypothetical protein PHI35_08195, partial [Victivallaceae bacterium]|nr:hypothetical protein [Victivallaceae bacterium]